MEELIEEIECPEFVAREKVLKRLTFEINAAKDLTGKTEYAHTIISEVEPLLSCEKRDEKKTDCKNCFVISSLRKKAVDMIFRMHQIARQG